MRIAVVVYGSLEILSGGYLYDRKLVEFLRQSGDEVEVISQPWSSYAGHLGHNLQPKWAARLQGLKIDLLLQDELNHPSLAGVNARLRGRVGYPILAIVHHLRSSEVHPPWLLPLYRRVERAYLGGVDGFIWNSQTTRRAVQALLGAGARADGLVATPAGDRFGGGLAEEQIRRRCRLERPLQILFVGNLIERKGLHSLLAALGLLRDLPWALEVVGRADVEPVYSARIKKFIQQNQLGGRVHFSGSLADEDLRKCLSEADLLVMVSSYEGFGIVYLEGMGFGLPAVASRAGAAGEIIQDGVNGRLVAPENPGELAAALRPYLERGEPLLAQSLAARRRFGEFPGWNESMQKIRHYLLTRVLPNRQ